jgi:hypothetical protein
LTDRLQLGENKFRIYANLPYPGHANLDAIKSYQIALYFDGANYIAGASPGIAVFVDGDGIAHPYRNCGTELR